MSHPAQPMKTTSISVVKIPAPARSPAVIGSVYAEGSGLAPGPPTPADGSPLLVPPVELVTGGATLVIRFDWNTSIALICSPMPLLPSHFSSVHFNPQLVPLFPPVHVFAAARAEARSFGMMWSYVKGAICVVAAIQRAMYALNERWSTMQVFTVSQARSYMTSLGLSAKKTSDALRIRSTRSLHVGSPFV